MTDDTEPVVVSLVPNMDAPEAIEFYRWLGLGVAVWAYIDRRLYQIFHHATGFEQKQSALVFYGDRAFGSRLDRVNTAVKATGQYVDEWRALRSRAKTLSHTRNILAHHPTRRIGTAKDGKPFDIYSIHIEPYMKILDDNYPGLQGKAELRVEDLRQHDTEVTELESKLCDFVWRMGGWRASQKNRP
jgi:hypothetical protein